VVQAVRGYPQNLRHADRAPDRHNSRLNVALERRVVLIMLLSVAVRLARGNIAQRPVMTRRLAGAEQIM
jgi:hypothetical protein